MTLRDALSRAALLCAAGTLSLATLARDARADMVQTTDGKWWPESQEVKDAAIAADDEPGDDLLRLTEEYKVTAEYDVVKLSKGGFNKPAGLVKRILTTPRAANQVFKEGLIEASGNDFKAAAEAFGTASADLEGGAKQEALYLRVQSYAYDGDADKAKAAADELLAAFPKSFWLCEVQVLKAKIAAGDTSAVEKLLAAVKDAPGMNARDSFRAEYWRIFLNEENRSKFDAARASYTKLISAVEATAASEAAGARQQAQVGIGNCLVGTGKHADAEAQYLSAIADARDPDVLAGAYAGLGDVTYMKARELQQAKKGEEAKAKLEDATLHYLRVTLLYKEAVQDNTPVLHAYENQIKVLVSLFELTNSKDCELAKRAYASYKELSDLMPDGPNKRQLIRDAKAFDEKRTAAGCK